MSRLIQKAFVLAALMAGHAYAKAPATPKEALIGWTEHAASWSLDEGLRVYHARGEKEAKFARAMAGQALIEAKLAKVVRDKWGKDAELAVARAISNDTVEDDQATTETIDGDRATLSFKDEANLPTLYLVKVNGEWKLDVAAFIHELGDQAASAEQYLNRSTKLVQTVVDDLKADKFKDSATVTSYLKSEFNKLNEP